jgi:nucleoside phosphorylase
MNDAYSRLCIVTAVDLEFQTVSRLLQNPSGDSRVCEGMAGRRRVTLFQSGMRAPGWAGRVQPYLASRPWDALLVLGFAGALAPGLQPGDGVVYDRCLALPDSSNKIESDRDEIASISSDNYFSRFVFDACKCAGLRISSGTGVMMDRVITRSVEKCALAQAHRAHAVDMETFAIWQAVHQAGQAGLPVAALRIVSDDLHADLPDFNRAYRRNGTLIMPQMARALLARPVASGRFFLGLKTAVASLRIAAKALFDA